MLTVKYVAPDGSENIRECFAVVADQTEYDGSPRVLIFDDTPHWDKSNSVGVYTDPGDSAADLQMPTALNGGPLVYVMNRFGATVGRYPLRRHRVAEPLAGAEQADPARLAA